MMKRLVCVVEGKGEVAAIPSLVARILRDNGRHEWVVDQEPIRHSRSLLVDERRPSPLRPPREDGLEQVLCLARARKATAVVVLVDADNDCAATWGKAATGIVTRQFVGGAVMAVREFESWLLASFSNRARSLVGAARIEHARDAKGLLQRLEPGYKPTTHQLRLTRRIDIGATRRESESFDKFVRTVLQTTSGEP